MLVLTRNKGTTVRIGDDIAVTVVEFRAEEVVLQIDYPSVLVLKDARGEVKGEPCEAESAEATPPAGLPKLRASISLKFDDAFWLGEDIRVMVVALLRWGGFPDKARLGFQAPAHFSIVRSELGSDETVAGKNAFCKTADRVGLVS